jgi:cell division protein FtsZ
MHTTGFSSVDYIACNTDSQALKAFPDDIIRLQLGAELTKGLGAGTDWKIGKQAAIESENAIREVLAEPTEMVFITAGMGGGTGTGAAPEIARIAKSLGRLTVGVVTDPFRKRYK